MGLPGLSLFDVRYDWATDTWTASVLGPGGRIACRTGFALEIDAQESLAELRRMLAAAPEGDVPSVLEVWEGMK